MSRRLPSRLAPDPRAGIPVDTQWRRRLEIEAIRVQAKDDAKKLIDDPFWVAGVVRYWAEGSKTNRRLQLAHTEPEALDLFRHWTRTYHAEQAVFRAAINLHANNDEGRPVAGGHASSTSIPRPISRNPSSSRTAPATGRTTFRTEPVG